jgi:hypothetical protein
MKVVALILSGGLKSSLLYEDLQYSPWMLRGKGTSPVTLSSFQVARHVGEVRYSTTHVGHLVG